MQTKKIFFVFIIGITFASCATLKDGYYQYDFTRTFKGIEDEWSFAQNYGMKYVQELTLEQTGTVTAFKDRILYDPVLQIDLAIDRHGNITSADNVSVHGEVQRNGKFYWDGVIEQHGRLNAVFVSGTLLPLPKRLRAGSEYDGIYHVTDMGTGKEQLVRISDGFYTWRFADGGTPDWTPWPTLVNPDGTFAFSMDMTTVMQMGEQKTSSSTGFASQGTVTAGKSIVIREYVRTTGTQNSGDENNEPLIYSGGMMRDGEYPADALPADIGRTIAAGKAAGVRLSNSAQKPAVNYPEWYLFPPYTRDTLYAVGEKTFADKETALVLAEAAAAARIAEYIRIHVDSVTTAIGTNTNRRLEKRVSTQSAERVPYTVVKSEYDEKSSTAFVLVVY
ncbi:hypothetical protein FACS189491_01780 [Spirochaetia bacterium]|nr:hypothetical protein FACS189491_01780 [Spirochaetia bacterium]